MTAVLESLPTAPSVATVRPSNDLRQLGDFLFAQAKDLADLPVLPPDQLLRARLGLKPIYLDVVVPPSADALVDAAVAAGFAGRGMKRYAIEQGHAQFRRLPSESKLIEFDTSNGLNEELVEALRTELSKCSPESFGRTVRLETTCQWMIPFHIGEPVEVVPYLTGTSRRLATVPEFIARWVTMHEKRMFDSNPIILSVGHDDRFWWFMNDQCLVSTPSGTKEDRNSLILLAQEPYRGI